MISLSPSLRESPEEWGTYCAVCYRKAEIEHVAPIEAFLSKLYWACCMANWASEVRPIAS